MADILIIDDDELMVSSLAMMVRRLGHDSASAGSLGDGIEWPERAGFRRRFPRRPDARRQRHRCPAQDRRERHRPRR